MQEKDVKKLTRKCRRGKENVDPGAKAFPVNFESASLLTLKFPQKLWRMVHECRTGAIGWDETGAAVVVNYALFQRDYLSKHSTRRHTTTSSSGAAFKTSNLTSFIRQMNLYGFHKSIRQIVNFDQRHGISLTSINNSKQHDQCRASSERVHVFRHHLFIRGRADLLRFIARNTSVRSWTSKDRPSKPRSRYDIYRVDQSNQSTVLTYSSRQPLTSRKIRRCQMSLTKALERAASECEMKHAVDRTPNAETVLTSSYNVLDEIVMDNETEHMLNNCVEQQVNYDLAEDFNDDFPLQWDSLCDWQSNTVETENDDFQTDGRCDFETVNAESIGISEYSHASQLTSVEDTSIFTTSGKVENADNNDLEFCCRRCEETLDFIVAQPPEQLWDDDNAVPHLESTILNEKVYEIFSSVSASTAADDNEIDDQLGEHGDENGATVSFASASLRSLDNLRVSHNVVDSPVDPRKKLIELAAFRPDLTRELHVQIDDDDYYHYWHEQRQLQLISAVHGYDDTDGYNSTKNN